MAWRGRFVARLLRMVNQRFIIGALDRYRPNGRGSLKPEHLHNRVYATGIRRGRI